MEAVVVDGVGCIAWLGLHFDGIMIDIAHCILFCGRRRICHLLP